VALWRELKDRFPDKSVFVPTIARYAISWNERLIARLDDEAESSWTEQLLAVLSEVRGGIKLQVEVRSSVSTALQINSYHAAFGVQHSASDNHLE
jgi:hypothetical protein